MTGTLRQYLRWAVASAVALAALAGAASAMATSPAASVYTQTNDPAGNRVQVLEPSQGVRSRPRAASRPGAGLRRRPREPGGGRHRAPVAAGSERRQRRALALPGPPAGPRAQRRRPLGRRPTGQRDERRQAGLCAQRRRAGRRGRLRDQRRGTAGTDPRIDPAAQRVRGRTGPDRALARWPHAGGDREEHQPHRHLPGRRGRHRRDGDLHHLRGRDAVRFRVRRGAAACSPPRPSAAGRARARSRPTPCLPAAASPRSAPSSGPIRRPPAGSS